MNKLFDHDFFARLNRLRLASHIRLDQGQSGNRKSSARGSSVEFSDFREYLPGDDIRRIDWNAYGRLERLYIKQFMEEKEAWYHILIDSSASMDFGACKKSDMALKLAAVFAWLVQKQLDRVEVISASAGRLDPLAPVTGRGGFQRLLLELEKMEFSGTTALSEAIRRMRLPGKGICIILSDFLDPAGIGEALRYLTYKHQEVLLLQILAREEVEFEAEGTLALRDMETGKEVRLAMSRQTIGAYQDRLKQHQEDLAKTAARYGCKYLQVISDQNLEEVIFETLQKKGIFG